MTREEKHYARTCAAHHCTLRACACLCARYRAPRLYRAMPLRAWRRTTRLKLWQALAH